MFFFIVLAPSVVHSWGSATRTNVDNTTPLLGRDRSPNGYGCPFYYIVMSEYPNKSQFSILFVMILQANIY